MNEWDRDRDRDRDWDFTIHIDEIRAIEVRAVSIKFRTKNLEFMRAHKTAFVFYGCTFALDS